MRDVSRKADTLRTARAAARIAASPASMALIREGRVTKGDPLPVARVAAIQAAKRTSQLIPYCHDLPLDFVQIEFELEDDAVLVLAEVKAVYKTGVEMEALTAVAVAALTIYDMLKMEDDSLRIEVIELLKKSGGKSSLRQPDLHGLKCAVLVLSDSVAAGTRADASGELIRARLEAEGLEVTDFKVCSDDLEPIVEQLENLADDQRLDLVLTTGGTGLGPRDNTPDA
ncbi:MAG TPA: bifunctional molybdenum cofactor biosynthesis protein MoaC/MoaB, partial [Firmicutes bacterium]|nr:bifunctional molybdenum cofactor biosynthesis protein MoaC/MoaB [Bacillota bacterium]